MTIKNTYDGASLPQVWDELRRKVNDAAAQLPQGVGQPIVVDDFGDVYGVFLAVTADGYSYAELTDYVDGWALVVFNGSKSLLDLLSISVSCYH